MTSVRVAAISRTLKVWSSNYPSNSFQKDLVCGSFLVFFPKL